jgi:hypothetical protein
MWRGVHFSDVDFWHTPAMTDVVQNPDTVPHERSRTGLSADALRRGIVDHLRYSIGRPAAALRPEHYYRALALAVRDRMQDNRVASTQTSLDLGRKVTCYLSAEFLMGPQLGSNLLNLGIEEPARVLHRMPGPGECGVAGHLRMDADVGPEHRAQRQVLVRPGHHAVLRRHLERRAGDRQGVTPSTAARSSASNPRSAPQACRPPSRNRFPETR